VYPKVEFAAKILVLGAKVQRVEVITDSGPEDIAEFPLEIEPQVSHISGVPVKIEYEQIQISAKLPVATEREGAKRTERW
jgi:hypothetical protein